jgi:cold shock CspA family protein
MAAGGPPIDATVKWFNAEKGFGFVEVSDGSGDAFLHIRVVETAGHSEMQPGTKLTIRTAQGQKGPQVTEILEVDTSSAEPARGGGMGARGPGGGDRFGGGGGGYGGGGGPEASAAAAVIASAAVAAAVIASVAAAAGRAASAAVTGSAAAAVATASGLAAAAPRA